MHSERIGFLCLANANSLMSQIHTPAFAVLLYLVMISSILLSVSCGNLRVYRSRVVLSLAPPF